MENKRVFAGGLIAGACLLYTSFAIRQMRAEYKKSALLHDIVVPIIVTEADRVTVSLCSEDEAPFVVVELTGR